MTILACFGQSVEDLIQNLTGELKNFVQNFTFKILYFIIQSKIYELKYLQVRCTLPPGVVLKMCTPNLMVL